MSGLLTSLGGSKGTLWAYFRSKDDLFAAVIEEVTSSFQAELGEKLLLDKPIESVLKAFCLGLMLKITAPESIAAWRLVVAESGRFPQVGQIFYAHASQRTESILSGYLSQLVTSGKLRTEDPLVMARTLISLCTAHRDRLQFGIQIPTENQLEEDASRFARIFLRAFADLSVMPL